MNIKQQRGSGSSFFLLAVIIIFSLWFFFKLFPMYMENWNVSSALEQITEEKDVVNKMDGEIRQMLLNFLSEKNIKLFDKENVKQYVTIERLTEKGIVEITVEYEQTKSLIGNISFLVKFKNTVAASS